MPNTFVDAYLNRRRQLEVDRTAKEQFERDMALREQAQQAQNQFQMEQLNQQQRDRAERAKEFAAQMDQRKAELEQQRGLDVLKLESEGAIRAPRSMEVPLNPPGQEGPSMQAVLEKLGVPSGQGTVTETPTQWGGRSFVFRPPEERQREMLTMQKDLELKYDDEARNRRIAAFENAVKSGQLNLTGPQLDQVKAALLVPGANVPQAQAEPVYMWAMQKLAKDPTNRELIYIADAAKKWMQMEQQSRAIPYGALNTQNAYKSMADILKEEFAKEGYTNPKQEIPPEVAERVQRRAVARSLAFGGAPGVQGVDMLQPNLPKPAEEQDPIQEYVNKFMREALKNMPTPGRGMAGR